MAYVHCDSSVLIQHPTEGHTVNMLFIVISYYQACVWSMTATPSVMAAVIQLHGKQRWTWAVRRHSVVIGHAVDQWCLC